jgi:DNA mismatch repair protein MutL
MQELWGTPGWPFPETPTALAGVAEQGISYGASGHPLALGQVQNTYIIAATFDGLVVVDQHAAHESVLAEQLLSGAHPIPLSPPARVDVTPHEADLLGANLGLLADLGLEIEPFGGTSFAVRSLPAPLAQMPASELITELIEELAAGRHLAPDEMREKVAHKAACRAAVKAGDFLTPAQQQALLDDLMAAWSPATCPHGRPALFTLSVEEIERRFLRR